jgi:T-complex protein 1 subunit epsilon
LLDKGLHPLKISDGFERACELAVQKLESISEEVDIEENDHQFLKAAAMTSLGSKVVSNFKKNLADITTEAILTVADLKRKDVNFELIKINGKTGGFKSLILSKLQDL